MNFKVQIVDDRYARVYNERGKFTIIPFESCVFEVVAKIIDWTGREERYVDRQGRCKHTNDNFAWLIDLAMEHGLRFPAIEEQND